MYRLWPCSSQSHSLHNNTLSQTHALLQILSKRDTWAFTNKTDNHYYSYYPSSSCKYYPGVCVTVVRSPFTLLLLIQPLAGPSWLSILGCSSNFGFARSGPKIAGSQNQSANPLDHFITQEIPKDPQATFVPYRDYAVLQTSLCGLSAALAKRRYSL